MMGAPRPDLDQSVPVLLVKVGLNPFPHGMLGAIRSLGRLNTPVYGIVDNRFTAAACSRYLTGRFCWPITGRERSEELVSGLLRIGTAIGKRALILATDDEAAVLIAEHATELRTRFIVPHMDETLPRTLASKSGLYAVCIRHGIPTARSLRPSTPGETLDGAAEIGFPLVIKNDEPWLRLVRPGVGSTAIVENRHELSALVRSWTLMPTVVMQEYLPRESSSDWIAHAYWGEDVGQRVVFTGRKLRSWPPYAGVTSCAYTCRNPELTELTAELCSRVGFRGICDLDWRFDARTRRYNLVDFNPRMGAQFRLFETPDGIDVVRAMHLDLTGREIPPRPQVDGRRYVVETLDLPAAIAYRLSGAHKRTRFVVSHRERAWWAPDDPMPAVVACVRSGSYAVRTLMTGRLGSSRVSVQLAARSGNSRLPARHGRKR